MVPQTKSKSPFYPGQPVPVEFFIGRQSEIDRITRALRQVAVGKPQAVFVVGEYGIGKSSLAGLMRFLGEKENSLFGVHVLLGGANTLEEVAAKTVEAVLRSNAYEQTWSEAIRDALAKYVGTQGIFGFDIHFEQLKADAPDLSRGYLPLLQGLHDRLRERGSKGIVLILDEINGITSNDKFAHFIKGLVDENALSSEPLPLLLMLCGVEERRREMIEKHRPIERIFEVAEMSPMGEGEVREFFEKAFGSEDMKIDEAALSTMVRYSGGYPKLMHIIGDAAFWIDRDGIVDKDDANSAVVAAAEDVGRKFVDQQVYQALRSNDYRSILKKLGTAQFDLVFHKSQIATGLTEGQSKKLNNFLQKMKKLHVIKAGDNRGEYIFTNRLARLYILLRSLPDVKS